MVVQYIRTEGNTATDFCIAAGGSLQGAIDSEGMPYNYCVFPTCETCESWSYYAGQCEPSGENICPVGAPEPSDNMKTGLLVGGIVLFMSAWAYAMFGKKGILKRR